jgi:hypothetical protein
MISDDVTHFSDLIEESSSKATSDADNVSLESDDDAGKMAEELGLIDGDGEIPEPVDHLRGVRVKTSPDDYDKDPAEAELEQLEKSR